MEKKTREGEKGRGRKKREGKGTGKKKREVGMGHPLPNPFFGPNQFSARGTKF